MSIVEEYVIELLGVKGVNRYLEEGNPETDTALRDNENVSLKKDIRGYFKREVLSHLSASRT